MDSETGLHQWRHFHKIKARRAFLCSFLNSSLSVDRYTQLTQGFTIVVLMVLKRNFHEDEGLGLEQQDSLQESKRQQTLETVARYFMSEWSTQDLSKVESFMRRVVREELDRIIPSYIQPFPRPSLNQIEASGSESRGWLLHFGNSVPKILFTNNKIEAEGNGPLQIVIVDASSNAIIRTGPLSSLKIEILVLDGDFGDDDDKQDWSEREFDASVIREREGRRPLLTGELSISLRNGVGLLGDITFTDNSSWIRSRRFKLGARAVRRERIREARSTAFIVKDQRGEVYKKHHPPTHCDAIWRLDKIGKDGVFHKRLAAEGVHTVQDLLRLLVINPSSLRSMFGMKMSRKKWDTILSHAKNCILDTKRYIYHAGVQVVLMFNSIYEVVGASFDGQSFVPKDNFTMSQMSLVEVLKQHAYQHLHDMTEIDDVPPVVVPQVLPLEAPSIPEQSLDMQLPDFQMTNQDQPATHLDFNNSMNPLPQDQEDHHQLEDVAVIPDFHPLQHFTPYERNSFSRTSSLHAYVSDRGEGFSGGSSSAVMTDEHFQVDDIISQISSWFPAAATCGEGNDVFLVPGKEMGISLHSSLPELSGGINSSWKPSIRWFKLRTALKWGISVRKDVAARRRAAPLQNIVLGNALKI